MFSVKKHNLTKNLNKQIWQKCLIFMGLGHFEIESKTPMQKSLHNFSELRRNKSGITEMFS